jgi:hypothetical protein
MKLYLLERNDDPVNYDIFNGFVIVAKSPEEAFQISLEEASNSTWPTKVDDIKITEIGKANFYMEKGIILSDFLAG